MKKAQIFKIIFIILWSVVVTNITCYAQEYSEYPSPIEFTDWFSSKKKGIDLDIQHAKTHVMASETYHRLLSKGTTEEEILSILGYPDEKKKNFWGNEIWHYYDINIYGESYGENCVEFKNDKVISVGCELAPAWMADSYRVVQVIFFPLYILYSIPGVSLLQFPIVFGCLMGFFLFEWGWKKLLCAYVVLGTVAMMLPWIMLLAF